MVRAGSGNEIIEDVRKNSIIAIGFDVVEDIRDLTRKEVKEKYRERNPDYSKRRIEMGAGELFRFAHEVKKEDVVLTYDKSSREILIGEVKSDYLWKPGDAPEGYPHVRRVEWEKKVSRDEFSEPARNSLGSHLTVFSLDKHIQEIESIL